MCATAIFNARSDLCACDIPLLTQAPRILTLVAADAKVRHSSEYAFSLPLIKRREAGSQYQCESRPVDSQLQVTCWFPWRILLRFSMCWRWSASRSAGMHAVGRIDGAGLREF